MALHHAASGEMLDIRPLGKNLQQIATHTLYKSDQFQVLRMVLLAGKSVPPHSVPGDISLQCLEGSIELTAADVTQMMRAGDLVCLAGDVTHALRALEDASVLVTIMKPQT